MTTPVDEGRAIALLANGMPATQVAKVLGCSSKTIYRLKAKADNRRLIAELREGIRVETSKAMSTIKPRLHARLEKAIDRDDARDVDALSRAALNVEKVSASASGELLQRGQQPASGVNIILTDFGSGSGRMVVGYGPDGRAVTIPVSGHAGQAPSALQSPQESEDG